MPLTWLILKEEKRKIDSILINENFSLYIIMLYALKQQQQQQRLNHNAGGCCRLRSCASDASVIPAPHLFS